MAPQLDELTAHAQALTSSGDLAAAREVLADALAPTDADPSHASPDLAAAAALFARILVRLGDPQSAEDWAGFAHTAQRRLYGADDQRTLAATATHAAVLHRVGNHAEAVELYGDVVEQLTETDGPDSLQVLAAQADLATAEHAAGACAPALARLTDAWQQHRRLHGDAAPAGIKMLARLGGMERDCGQSVESRAHLAMAAEFCARYLPGDHALARQVAALARTPRSEQHRCSLAPPAHPDHPTHLDDPAYLDDPADPGYRAGSSYPAGPDHPTSPGPAGPDHPTGLGPGAPGAARRPGVLVAVIGAGVLAAGAAVWLTMPTGNPGPVAAPSPAVSLSPTGTPSATPGSAAPGSAAPGSVVLRDGRDSVTLEWAYPTGAEGPVLISGGRAGQERRAFQQVPAGSVSYVVYGLNERSDYCFTVAVVYAADNVAEAAPVCTARG